MSIDLSKVSDIDVDGIDTKDYPDFCDAYISSATYDGREMSEEELNELNEDHCFVHEQVFNRIF